MILKLQIFTITLACLFGIILVTAPNAHGFDPFKGVKKSCDKGAEDSSICKVDGTKNPIAGKDGIITKIANIISIVTGLAAVIVIMISGFQYITAGGNPEKAASAKNILLYAVIGLLVAALAQALVVLVLSKL